jgi:glycosyltransferase involved in cell wall biosynthesis
MKIVFVIAERNYGATSLLVGQILSLKSNGLIDLYCVAGTTEKEVGLFDKLEKNDVSVVKIQGLEFNQNWLGVGRDLVFTLQRINPDIVHIQTNWQLSLFSFVKFSGGLGFKIVYTIHAFRHNSGLVKSALAILLISGALLFFADRVIVCSTYTFNKFKILRYKMSLLYLGVDDSFYGDINIANIPNFGKLSVFFAGDFRKGKNQEMLIRAFSKCHGFTKGNIGILYLPGDGPLKTKCEQLARDLGISQNVVFPGFLTKQKIIEAMKSADIAVVPTNSETFGLCIAEPFSLGKCVITRNVGVGRDIINNGVNGFIFNTEDELLCILNQVSNNRDLLSEVCKAAYDQRDIFNWATISLKYFEIMKGVK